MTSSDKRHVMLGDQPETTAPMGKPPLMPLDYVVLVRVVFAPNPVCGRDICQSIFPSEGLPYAPIYRALSALEKSGCIRKAGTVRLKSAPPLKIYRATAAGRRALIAARDHYQALVHLAASV